MAAIVLMIGFRMCESVSDLLEGRYQQKNRYDVSCRAVFVKTALYLAGFVVVLLVTRNLLMAIAALGIVYLISVVVIDGTLIRGVRRAEDSFFLEEAENAADQLPAAVCEFVSDGVCHQCVQVCR